MIIRVQTEPFIAGITQHPFRVEFAHIGILCEHRVTLLESINILTASLRPISNANRRTLTESLHFLRQATLSVCVPGDGAVGGIWAQTDPLVTRRAKHAIRLELGHVWICTKIVDAFFFSAFSTTTFGGRVGKRLSRAFGGINNGRGGSGGGTAVKQV